MTQFSTGLPPSGWTSLQKSPIKSMAFDIGMRDASATTRQAAHTL